MVRIFYDKDKSAELTRRMEERFEEESKKNVRGDEIHVSDLTGCLLKPYCRMVGIEVRRSKSSVGFMVFGIIAENILGWIYPKNESQHLTSLHLIDTPETVVGHLDIYENMEYPIECKMSRKSIFKQSDLPLYWVEQLISYMSMEGKTIGWLVFFNVFTTQIMAFKFILTQREILDWLVTISLRISNLKTAVKKKDPNFIVEIRAENYEYCGYKRNCPRRLECRRKAQEIELIKKREKAQKKLNK